MKNFLLSLYFLLIPMFYFRSEIQYSIDDDTESLHKELDPDLNTTTPIIKPSSNNKPKGNSSPLASNGDLKGTRMQFISN